MLRKEPFPLGIIWNSQVPSKVSFFAWEACWVKVLTLDQLQRRGWLLVNTCALCKEKLESIDHIFLHCAMARIIWSLVFSLFGIPWVISASVWDTLLGWQGSFVGRKRTKAWRAAPLCNFWTIQKERNGKVFEDEEMPDQSLKSYFLKNLALWIRVCINGRSLSLID